MWIPSLPDQPPTRKLGRLRFETSVRGVSIFFIYIFFCYDLFVLPPSLSLLPYPLRPPPSLLVAYLVIRLSRYRGSEKEKKVGADQIPPSPQLRLATVHKYIDIVNIIHSLVINHQAHRVCMYDRDSNLIHACKLTNGIFEAQIAIDPHGHWLKTTN